MLHFGDKQQYRLQRLSIMRVASLYLESFQRQSHCLGIRNIDMFLNKDRSLKKRMS